MTIWNVAPFRSTPRACFNGWETPSARSKCWTRLRVILWRARGKRDSFRPQGGGRTQRSSIRRPRPTRRTAIAPHRCGGRPPVSSKRSSTIAAGAIDAWVVAASCDIAYLDVYRRLAALYRSQGQLDALAALTDTRIDAGADTPTLVGLLLEKARQRRDRGDSDGVIDALRECLELDPHHFAALKELVDTHRAAQDWQGAAEALIRIARLNRTTDEQVWAFSQLAEVYDVHLQDLPRAEASLRHVAKLLPAQLETLDRLATVLSRQGKAVEAAKLLEELVRRAGSDVQDRDYRIRLATAVEAAGQARQAELMLENLRSEQPTEPDVILALADHFQRQGAGPAEAMHLNRAVADLRTAIDAHPDSESLWTTLARVLNRRHGPGPASCAASAAIAIGHPASLFEGDVTTRNEALGEAKVPLSSVVDSIVAPQGLPHPVRRLFALCEHSFDKVLPFDASAWSLRRPSGPHRGLIEEAGAVAEVLGISEPRLKVTYVAPAACMPITGDPPTIVVGGNLHEMTTPRERVFLFARALKVASNHLAPALRARPEELDVALLALLQGHGASHAQRPEPRQMQGPSQEAAQSRAPPLARRSRELGAGIAGPRGVLDTSRSICNHRARKPCGPDPNRGRSIGRERPAQDLRARCASQRYGPVERDSGDAGGVGLDSFRN